MIEVKKLQLAKTNAPVVIIVNKMKVSVNNVNYSV